MLRSTVNESIINASKLNNFDTGRGESIELVYDDLNNINAEAKDTDTHIAAFSQFPSNRHNGPKE